MERYRAVFDACPDGILLVDGAGVIRDLNPQALTLFGYGGEELLGKPVEVLVPEAVRGVHGAHRDRYAADPRPRPMGIGLELEGRRKDGVAVPVEISLSPLEVGGEMWTIVMVRDVGEQRRLRRFGRGSLLAAEEERRRIARELHDDTAQALAGLLVRMKVLERTEGVAERAELLAEMHEALEGAVEGVRRISRGLRPPALEDAGVVAAIHAQGEEMAATSGIPVEVVADGVDEALDPDARLVVYRVVQEALTNVIRHARGASWARVSLRKREEGDVVAEIVDDGAGFESTPHRRSGEGLGLVGMEERAASVGGSLVIESAPGEGTRVRLTLPARTPTGVADV